MNKLIKKKAFTLVELLMVLGIISIMLILLIPSLNPIKTEVKNVSIEKNKETFKNLVEAKASRLSSKGLEGDDLLNEIVKELLEEPSIINMTNPFDTSKKGVGLILGNTYDDTNKAAYLFSEEPIVESLPKGTIFFRINPEELVSNGTGTIPGGSTVQTTPTMFSNSLSDSTILLNNNTYVFGSNVTGQLGIGDTISRELPIQLILNVGVKPKSIVVGNTHSLAIGTDGNLYSWGNNGSSQLGNGTTVSTTYPILINLPGTVKPTSIAIGFSHSLAIGDDGNLYTWGENQQGQLGDGTTANKTTPTLINLPNGTKPKSISAGASYSIAIGDDGNLYTWGYNYNSQLGTGDAKDRLTPTLINLPNGAKPKSIVAGVAHTLVLGDDGNLYAWGDNTHGQLGDGTTTNKTTPKLINLPNNVKPISITAGIQHSLAIGTDGNLYTWGYNTVGQLGDGTTTNNSVPTLINLPYGAKPKSISAGTYHIIIITTNNDIYACGLNNHGQLGTGDTINRLTLTLVKPLDLLN